MNAINWGVKHLACNQTLLVRYLFGEVVDREDALGGVLADLELLLDVLVAGGQHLSGFAVLPVVHPSTI